MAEVFGIIGAGVGVVAAAGQLIDGIMKLQSFCSQIQNIPEDIQTAVDDLSTMVEVLELVQIEMGHETLSLRPSNHSSFLKVLSNLEQSSQQVGEVLEEMRTKLGKKRYWGRMKAVGLIKKLEKATKRVENAQRMVLILLAVENRISFRHSGNIQSAQAKEANPISTRMLSMPSVGQPTRKISGNTREIEDTEDSNTTDENYPSAGSTPYHLIPKFSKAKGQGTASIKLRIPHFFLNPVWEFSVYRANQGWDFSLRSYNIRPRNATIFKAIQEGDLTQVRKLLHNGSASIWDQTSDGFGVLHYAVSSCPERGTAVLEYLVKSGADIYSVNIYGKTAHYHLLESNFDFGDEQKDLRLLSGYKVFTSHRDWIPSCPRMSVSYDDKSSRILSEMIDTLPIYMDPPEEIIRAGLQEMWPPWKDMSPADRMNTLFPDVAVSTLTRGMISPLSVRACLSREFIQQTFASWDTRNKGVLIDYVFGALAQQLRLKKEKETKEARLFLKDMHMANGLISVLPKFDSLGRFVTEYVLGDMWDLSMRNQIYKHRRFEDYVDVAQKALKNYISELLILGIDMVTIIDIEEKLRLTRRKILLSRGFEFGLREGWLCEVIAIDYGLKVEDWHLWISNPLDEWAGEFWDMLDHPERTIPGAWDELSIEHSTECSFARTQLSA